jgi:hypothetical protein
VNIHESDTLVINKKQIKDILKDKTELNYRREHFKLDSLHIQKLETKVYTYKESEKVYDTLLLIKQTSNEELKKENKKLKAISLILFVITSYLIIK